MCGRVLTNQVIIGDTEYFGVGEVLRGVRNDFVDCPVFLLQNFQNVARRGFFLVMRHSAKMNICARV